MHPYITTDLYPDATIEDGPSKIIAFLNVSENRGCFMVSPLLYLEPQGPMLSAGVEPAYS